MGTLPDLELGVAVVVVPGGVEKRQVPVAGEEHRHHDDAAAPTQKEEAHRELQHPHHLLEAVSIQNQLCQDPHPHCCC